MGEPTNPIENIRKRPGMYVGDTVDGSGLSHLVFDVIANAYDQYLAGRCSSIALTLAADGTITVEDDGPGLPVDGALAALLTQLSTRATVDGHRPHVHLGLGGIGLCVVNALSERFEVATIRDGTLARTVYARGEVVEPIATAPTTRPSGTQIRFRPDPTIFAHLRVPRAELVRQLEDLSFLAPRLRFRWAFEGDDLVSHGLAGRVAVDVPCAIDQVAHARLSSETPAGPIEVEVALAWREDTHDPVVRSYVNLRATPEHGEHVEGLLDGIAAFFGDRRRTRGLVAAVSIVLADVIYGNPVKHRLVSPAARPPVREATLAALARKS